VLEAVAADAAPVVHCCADRAPLEVLTKAGARAVSVDMARIRRGEYDDYAGLVDQGVGLWLGVVPATDPDPVPRDTELVRRVQRLLEDLDVDPEAAGDRCVVTPSCGLAGATPRWARQALGLAGQVARHVSAEDGKMTT
jgi:methionine synthase II (cobalamin-independent)